MTASPGSAPLRIGMICPGYPSGAPGDYRGIFVRHMVQALKARGHRVCVVTSRLKPEDRPWTRVDAAEEVRRFPFWSEGKPIIEYSRIPVARMMTYMASAAVHGYRAFRGFGCDVIHSHFVLPTGLIGAALARALGRPHVATCHGSDVRLATGKRPMRLLARWTLGHSQAVTLAAEHQREGLRGLGVADDLLSRLPMGIHEVFLEQAEAAAPANPLGVISTRTLREEIYNISQLIRAMKVVAARAPGVACTIAGDGPDRARLETLARELGLKKQVTFTGWASPEQLARQLRAHRVYVSASRADGASGSLFEALACGAYPVVSDIPANREWIRNGENGRLFPLDNPEALAGAILGALADSANILEAIQQNRRTAHANFSWEGIALKLEEVYANALQAKLKRQGI